MAGKSTQSSISLPLHPNPNEEELSQNVEKESSQMEGVEEETIAEREAKKGAKKTKTPPTAIPLSSGDSSDSSDSSDFDREGSIKATRAHTWEGIMEVSAVSTFSKSDLKVFKAFYEIPSEIEVLVPKNGQHMSRSPQEKCWGVIESMFTHGNRIPATSFVNKFLITVNRAPSQLLANAWIHLSSFQTMCARLDIDPTLELFEEMYRVKHSCWVTSIQVKPKRLISNMPDKNFEDRYSHRWFFVTNAFDERVPQSWTYHCQAVGLSSAHKDQKAALKAQAARIRGVSGVPFRSELFFTKEVLGAAGLLPPYVRRDECNWGKAFFIFYSFIRQFCAQIFTLVFDSL